MASLTNLRQYYYPLSDEEDLTRNNGTDIEN